MPALPQPTVVEKRPRKSVFYSIKKVFWNKILKKRSFVKVPHNQ
mgnify:CR=1 FL=1